jgi:hypothetical protein
MAREGALTYLNVLQRATLTETATTRVTCLNQEIHFMLPLSALLTDAVQKLVIKYMKLGVIAQG